jgi:hypothetical protein
MDKNEANRLLDRLKETRQLSYADTTAALRVTGDYEDDGGAGMDTEISQESERPWENQSINMVVNGLIRYREKAWADCRQRFTQENE